MTRWSPDGLSGQSLGAGQWWRRPGSPWLKDDERPRWSWREEEARWSDGGAEELQGTSGAGESRGLDRASEEYRNKRTGLGHPEHLISSTEERVQGRGWELAP